MENWYLRDYYPKILEKLSQENLRRHMLALSLLDKPKGSLIELAATLRVLLDAQSLMLEASTKRIQEESNVSTMAFNIIHSLRPHLDRGKKIVDSAKRGFVAAYGTAHDIEKRRQKIRSTCEAIALSRPKWGLTSIRAEAAERLGVSFKTVQRATAGLKAGGTAKRKS